jgi:hypothetical protein
MRKLLIITALLLFAGIAFGQTLKKGNLIGVHVMSVELKPGATMEQYVDFYNKKVIPAWEKSQEGLKIFILKGIRGEQKNEFGMIVQFTDEAARDKSYNADGSVTEFGGKVQEKMAPIIGEAEKIGTSTSKYTDWLVL